MAAAGEKAADLKAIEGDGELSIVRVAREEHDANAERVGAGRGDDSRTDDGGRESGPDIESSGGLDPAALQAIEDEAEDDRKMMMDRHSSNRFVDMAEQVEDFDQELQRFEDGDDQPDTSERDAGGSKGKSEGTGLMAEEIERLKDEERASVQAVMEAASKRFYSSHRMHRTYLLHCFRDERLKIRAQRLGEVLGSVAADWVGMTDDERSLRSDFELRATKTNGALSGHAGGTHGLRRASIRDQMAELNQITRGVQAFVRADGPLAQRAKRDALAAHLVSWYPCGGERLVLTMSDLELAVQDVLKDTSFQREGVSKSQAALMMCQHPEVLLMYLQTKYYPVKLKDVQWMMKHSVRHWLQLAAAFEATDYEADRMRMVARNQRDETRKAWEAARKRQSEATTVVNEAKHLQEERDRLRKEALREREEMVEARIELEREKMEAEEAKTELSKEVMEAEAAEKRVQDLKTTALFKEKFQGKLLRKKQVNQKDIVDEAFLQVQVQRELVDGCERTIYTLQADLEKTKEIMDAAVKSKVRLRIQKAQETRKSQKLRLGQAKADLVLANEALDAALAVYEMELQELKKIESFKKETKKLAEANRAVGMFSNIVAVKERSEAEEAHARWEKEHEEATLAEQVLEKESAEATDADRQLSKARFLAQEKHKEAISHIKAVRYLDKEAQEAAAAATIIQAHFRGYQARSELVREMQEAKHAEAKASRELQKVEYIERRRAIAVAQLKTSLAHFPKGHKKVLQARKQLAQVDDELAAALIVADDALVFAAQERAEAMEAAAELRGSSSNIMVESLETAKRVREEGSAPSKKSSVSEAVLAAEADALLHRKAMHAARLEANAANESMHQMMSSLKSLKRTIIRSDVSLSGGERQSAKSSVKTGFGESGNTKAASARGPLRPQPPRKQKERGYQSARGHPVSLV